MTKKSSGTTIYDPAKGIGTSSNLAPGFTIGRQDSLTPVKRRKRKSSTPEVRVVRKDGTPVALVHSLSDQDAIEHVTGKHSAEVVNTLQAFMIGKEYKLDLVSTLPQITRDEAES